MEFVTLAYVVVWLLLAFAFVGTFSFANRVVYSICMMGVSLKLGRDFFDLLSCWIRELLRESHLIIGDVKEDSLLLARGFLTWASRQMHDPMFVDCLVLFCTVALLLIAYFKIEERPPKFDRYVRTYQPDFVPERMVPGSQFQLNAEMPRFQVEIYGTVDGINYYPAGQGFWVENSILTAAHVIYDFVKVKLVRDGVEVVVDADHFKTLDGDLAQLPVQPGFVGKLKMSKAKLARTGATKNGGLMAQVVAFGQRSFGFINPYEQFGYCSYGGSTIKGFSGAPYHLNNTIFGMHLGGNLDNLGYEGSYIRSLLKPTAKITTFREDSEEWLIDQAGREVELLYERSPFDMDEYKVKVGGSYHIVDSEVLGKLLNKVRGKKRNEDFSFDQEALDKPEPNPVDQPVEPQTPLIDLEPPQVAELPLCPRNAMSFQDQGNLMRAPVDVGARGQGEDLRSVLREELRTLREMVSKSQKPLDQSHLESLRSTHAQQSVPSQSTAARRNRKNKSNAQRLMSLEEQLSKLSSLIAAGQQSCPTQPQPSGSRLNSTEPLQS